ncbi:MAG: DUF4301 family protein, partial [Elusimicrobia bacterium]|nr:DUF4301 family protein [Elusimicrobiota bacterium]
MAEARRQVELLKCRRLNVPVVRPCSVGDGIERVTKAQADRLIRLARNAQLEGRFSSFVPASGAASRLFTSLIQLSQHCRSQEGPVLKWLRGPYPFSRDCRLFFRGLPHMSLALPLDKVLHNRGVSLKRCLRSGDLLP